MTELSADWARAHGTSALRMSRGGSSTEGADVFGVLRVYMVQRLTLEALYNGGSWWFRSIGDNDGVVACSGLHNHLQSSGEHNTSSVHSRSTLSANPSPASLSWCSIMMILFPWGKGGVAPEWRGKGFVTHSVVKVFLGSAKTKQAILTKRPTSFLA